jgi:para-nitrobenzyl esterase
MFHKLLLAGLCALTLGAASAPTVGVTGGQVAGAAKASGVAAYLGLPFAAPPVGSLRWKPPGPVIAWRGVRPATSFSPACMQKTRSPQEAVSEDCLYLNVWTPPGAKAGQKLPVVMWIYGGGFYAGSSANPAYDGEALAKKGVVLVSPNYRVGAFGYMAHPALDAEDPHHASGGYGFLDQVAALTWIQANIARFGGDPGNVTVMGNSAGSVSASALQASPLGKGLFQKTIGVSASAVTWEAGVMVPHAQALAAGVKAQQALGAADLAAMRALPAEKLVGVNVGPPGLDGWFMPRSPIAIYAEGKANDAATFVGFTRDEGYGPLIAAESPQAYEAAARQLYGADASKLLALYPSTDADWKHQAQLASRDITLGAAMRRWAMGQAMHGKRPAYAYLFSRVPPGLPGALHGSDAVYWLGNLDAQKRDWQPRDRELSALMTDMVVAFAKTGNPSLPGAVVPRYDSKDERLIELGDSTSVIPWPAREHVAMLHALKAAD